MRSAIFCLALLIAACSNDDVATPVAPSSTVTIDHRSGKHRLTPDMTEIRVTGLSYNGRQVITPPQTVPRQDVVTVPLNPRTRTVQIDYLNAAGQIVGQGNHGVKFQAGGGGVTLTDPLYDNNASDEKPDSSTGQYGLLDHSVHSSPQPLPSASPTTGIDLTKYFPQGWPIALPPQYIPTSPLFGPSPQLPSKVTLTNLPPIGAQGTSGINIGYPGSCIAWSFGAELGTFTAARNPDFTSKYTINNSTTDSNTASAMYLYEMALAVLPYKDTHSTWKGKPLGCAGSYNIYTSFLVGYGSATTSTLEYEPECGEMERGSKIVGTLPLDPDLMLGSTYTFWPTNQTAVPATLTVDQVKQFVAGGQAVAFATTVWNNFDSLPLANGVYYGSACAGGGHGMVIVGYDDNIGVPGQQGAFLVQNSFGSDWPEPDSSAAPCSGSPVPSPDASPNNPAGPGRFYLSYGAWYGYNTGGATAWPVDPSTPTSVMLSGPSGAPAAAINSTWQVTNGGTGTYLVLNHWFAKPLYMQSLTLTSPDGKKSATQPLGYALKNGYTWTLRLDARSFEPGTWAVSVATSDGAQGPAYTYTGNVTLGNVSAPFPSLPAAPLPAHVVGITGSNVAVTGNL